MPDFVQSLGRMFLQAEQIDQAAKPLQSAVSSLFQKAGPVGQKFADFLNGVWLGHPLHPVLTDVPIGAWTAAVALDAMEAASGNDGVGKAADAAIGLGVAGAVGSAVTGLADWQHTVGETRRVGFTHALLNTVALGFFLASMVQRKNRNRGMGRTLAMVGYGIAATSAYLGGDMVFRQRMGVNHAPDEDEIKIQDWVPVLAADQLSENQLTLAMLTNIPLVLLRREGRVYAMAETCAHLGGPLADGKVVDGENRRPVVVCPWHGSHFDMETGSVVQGPSSYPQPCFEARIHNGQVEIRQRAVEAEMGEGEAATV
jgi:nitrite reductase/ring-hydroxylating ferredoxin subunit/uncharacterized membrane protein